MSEHWRKLLAACVACFGVSLGLPAEPLPRMVLVCLIVIAGIMLLP
jgi:hypothetical protein